VLGVVMYVCYEWSCISVVGVDMYKCGRSGYVYVC
jgi:hypothetical protein